MTQIYRPLTGDEVRFVRLQPGAWTDAIQCDLVYLSLPNDQPDLVDLWFSSASSSATTSKISVPLTPIPTARTPYYVALSYVWGDPNDTKEILLNGQPVQKTSNLIFALRQLQASLGDLARAPASSTGHEILFWIDALCINQSDTTERSLQVPRMGAIYGYAARVIAWVGHTPNHEIQALMAMVNNFYTDDHLHTSESLWRTINSMSKDQLSDVIRGLKEILQLPWFQRVWVVQEAVMARETLLFAASHWCLYRHMEQVLIAILSIHGNHPVVHGGMWRVVQALQFSNSRNAIHATISAVSQKAKVSGICSPGDVTGKKEAYVYHEFLKLRKVVVRRPGASIFDDWINEARKSSKDADDAKEIFRTRLFAFILKNVLSSMRTTFFATLPHDYLYGVLSIGGSLGYPKILAPDYALPFSKVFHIYTMVILEHTGSLSIIPRLSGRLEGVPSWVPDYRSQRVPMVITHIDTETALQTSRRVSIVEDGRVCIILAYRMGDVKFVPACQYSPLHESTPYDIIIHFDGILENACKNPRKDKDIVVEDFLAQIRGLMGLPDSHESHWMFKNIYADCISGKLNTSNEGETSQRDVVEALASQIAKFPLLISSEGVVAALARNDEHPMVGDIILMIEGSTHPWLVRSVIDCDPVEYTFVGACRLFQEELPDHYDPWEEEIRLV